MPGVRPVRVAVVPVTVWVVLAGKVVTTYEAAEPLAVKLTLAEVVVMLLTLTLVGAAQATGAVMVKLAFEMSKK